MATVGPVTLSIFDQPPDQVVVQAAYDVKGSGDDISSGQPYREVVELIGVDKGQPGEDGVDDVLDTISDGTVVFDGTHVSFLRSQQKQYPAAALDEDPHPFFPRTDEIRVRVTLMPVAVGESNIVRREQILAPN